jgi:hypothetical protein
MQYAMLRNSLNRSRFAPFSRNDIALMSLMQRAQSDQADRQFGHNRLAQDQRQFEAEQRMAMMNLMMRQQAMQQDAAAQQGANQSRLLGQAIQANPALATMALSPEVQAAQQQQQQEDAMKMAELGLRHRKSDPQNRPPEAIVAALLADGRSEEEVQALLDRIGKGGTLRDPGGWDFSNYWGLTGMLGAKSPGGHRMISNPRGYFSEFFNSF